MKEKIRNGFISFAISAFAGLTVNMLIDAVVNGFVREGFISMSPDYVALFPTPALAAYVNVLLYGLIGFIFSAATFVYDMERLGFVLQSLIYFAVTGAACTAITVILWQLHKYPLGLVFTLCGYGLTHIIIIRMQYRRLKQDILLINERCGGMAV